MDGPFTTVTEQRVSSSLSYSETPFIMSNPVRRIPRSLRIRGQPSVNDILRMPGKWFLKSRRAGLRPRGDRESDDRGRAGRCFLVKLPRLNGARKNLREKYVRGVSRVRGRAGAKLREEPPSCLWNHKLLSGSS